MTVDDEEIKRRLVREVQGEEPGPTDHVVIGVSRDDRCTYARRRVGTAAVVCGRKPGVVLLSVTSDGMFGRLGVSSEGQARVIVEALRKAWPQALEER